MADAGKLTWSLGGSLVDTMVLVHIDKASIVRHLREHGRHEDAIRADRELPDRLHAVQDVEILRQLGLDAGSIEDVLRDSRPRDT